MLASMFGGCSELQLEESLGAWLLPVCSKHKSGKWSEREELVLGRSLDSLLAVAHEQT
jgi:hypothetical protein